MKDRDIKLREIMKQVDRAFYEYVKDVEQKFIGVDWAKDSGMNRGDVIRQDGNVVHVRFKTVGINQ